MSKIKNGGLDQYGAEPFKQQQFGRAGIEGVNRIFNVLREIKVSGQQMTRLATEVAVLTRLDCICCSVP